MTTYLYIYPTVVLCTWTVLCFGYLRVARKYSVIPLPVDVHPMACFLNMKADLLGRRPGVLAVVLSLVAAVVPVVNLFFCAFVLMAATQSVRLRRGRAEPALSRHLSDLDD